MNDKKTLSMWKYAVFYNLVYYAIALVVGIAFFVFNFSGGSYISLAILIISGYATSYQIYTRHQHLLTKKESLGISWRAFIINVVPQLIIVVPLLALFSIEDSLFFIILTIVLIFIVPIVFGLLYFSLRLPRQSMEKYAEKLKEKEQLRTNSTSNSVEIK